MYKSKLIRLYQTLDDAEIRQFKKWLKSPIHNKHKDVQSLFEYLFSRQSITAVTTQRDRAFQYLYPGEETNMARLRHVMSFATEVLEDFIRYKEYVYDRELSDLLLLKGLRKRALKKDAEKEERSFRNKLKKQEVQNEIHYWVKHQLEVEGFKLQTDGDRPTSTNLQEVMNSASLFFVLTTLRYACISITHQNLYKKEYNVPFLEAILTDIEAGKYADINSIQLYYACYLALTEPNEDKPYQLLKNYLIQFPKILPPKQFQEVYGIALNYCIKRSNKGNLLYMEEAFNLYMNGIENRILLDDGYLSHFAYKNIVGIGLYLGKIVEIETFIPKGKYLLHPDHRDNYMHYNTAKFYFATQKYLEAKKLLTSMDYDDLFMTIDAKMMLFKIYVEEGNFDVMEAYVHSFTQFLRRKSDLSYYKKTFLNTIRFAQKAIHAFTKEEKKTLAEQIQNTNPLPEKKWLLELLEK